MELSTLEAPDYFGEAAVLRRGMRHATAIATSSVEVLVLAKLDFDLKVDAETREVVGVLVAQYPKDPQLLRCAHAWGGRASASRAKAGHVADCQWQCWSLWLCLWPELECRRCWHTCWSTVGRNLCRKRVHLGIVEWVSHQHECHDSFYACVSDDVG